MKTKHVRMRKWPVWHICENCKKIFYDRHQCATRISKFCSRKCSAVRLRKYKKCEFCKKQFYNWANKYFCSIKCAGKFKRGRPLSEDHRKALKLADKNRPGNINERHHEWRGKKAGYGSKHDWIRFHYGKADRCENPDCVYPRYTAKGELRVKPKGFHWALIHGKEHDHKRENYWRLCVLCHRQYDLYEKVNNLFP